MHGMSRVADQRDTRRNVSNRMRQPEPECEPLRTRAEPTEHPGTRRFELAQEFIVGCSD
jgi:hypothetical protein